MFSFPIPPRLLGRTLTRSRWRFWAGLPLVFFLERSGIWLPILFHALYGFYIWYRGDGNTVEYPWGGNWMYTLQRWTGGVVFFYIVWHTYTMRFTGTDLHAFPNASFGKVQAELMNPLLLAFYVVGLIAACWHFAYGIWLFAAKLHHFRQEREKVFGCVPGALCGDDHSRPGEFVYVPGTVSATDGGAGNVGDANHPRDQPGHS